MSGTASTNWVIKVLHSSTTSAYIPATSSGFSIAATLSFTWATFADDIKGEGYSFQADWHFINLPVLLEGGELSDFDFTMPDVDVHQALEVLTAWMMEDGDYMQSTYYQ